jgi:dipeptidyl aminopeptidase/acylaminoacyl peptidase
MVTSRSCARARRLLAARAGAASLLALACAAATPPAAAQAPAASPPAATSEAKALPPLPAERFFERPEIEGAKLSPSGQWLALKVTNGSGRSAIAAFDLASGKGWREVANFGNVDVGQYHWVGDDRIVFDIADLSSGSHARRWGAGLFTIRIDGSGLRQLIATQSAWMPQGALAGSRPLSWHHQLLHVPGTGGEVVVGEWRFDGQGDPIALLPKRLDVASGRVRSLGHGLRDDALEWMFDPRGEPRVAIAEREGRVRVHWRADPAVESADAWVLLGEWPQDAVPWLPHSVGADGTFYVTVSEGDAGEASLTRLDLATRQPVRPTLVRTPGFDFVGRVLGGDDGGPTLGVRALAEFESTVWTDPSMKAVQDEIDRRLPQRINRLSCVQCTSARRVVLVRSWSDRQPDEYWLWRGDAAAPTTWARIGASRPGIDAERMAGVDFHRFAARDGRRIPLWVTAPVDLPTGAGAPAVLLVHGGPWVRGGAWRWDGLAQYLASRGYVVLEPEYRGSLGYGRQHFEAGLRQWGRAMQDDLADAVAWAAAQGWIDPKRTCIAGASYGGYAALMGVVRHGDVFRCAAAWVAVTEPALLFEGGWHVDVTEDMRRWSLPRLIGDPVKDAAMLRDISVVQHAARIRAPVLLAYGEEDTRVPIRHGERLRAALQAAGRQPQWVQYAKEGHHWQSLQTQLDFARRLEAFLAAHLR